MTQLEQAGAPAPHGSPQQPGGYQGPGSPANAAPAPTQALACLPREMRERSQWLLAGPNNRGQLKVPISVTANGSLYAGSSTNRATWLAFDFAMAAAHWYGYGLGFCLHPSDPFTCVDFDVKNSVNAPNEPGTWTSDEHIKYMQMLVEDLNSYTELSQSRQGVHVWCQGNIGEGIKRSGVEVYSQWRFIACTGLAINSKPIQDRQEMLSVLVSAMRQGQGADRVELDDAPQNFSDNKVMHQFWHARNAAKFRMLWNGEWQALGYPSQSEADQALMTQLAFYSQSNEQCRRLFRISALGQRDKAVKDDRYVDLTLRRSRSTHAPRLARMAAIAAAIGGAR